MSLVEREDDLLGAVARHHLALRDLDPQEARGDVEAAQARGHLLRGLRVERLVGIRPQLAGEHRVAEGPVAAQMEAHQRAGLHRHHHPRAHRREILDPRHVDARAQPARLSITVAHAAHAFLERH